MRLLLIEDEVKLATNLKKILEGERYAVEMVHDGEKGYEQATIEEYDLIILDIGLPSMSGVEVCTHLRADKVMTPILMLTARDTVKDRIKGLDTGADDYLVKPFEVDELLARIRVLLRRSQPIAGVVLSTDSLKMDTKRKMVFRRDRVVDLSPKEYALLEYMLHNQNQVISKQTLLEHVWGAEVDPFSNVIDVYIGYLRKKIDRAFPEEKPLIVTVKGMGYRLAVE